MFSFPQSMIKMAVFSFVCNARHVKPLLLTARPPPPPPLAIADARLEGFLVSLGPAGFAAVGSSLSGFVIRTAWILLVRGTPLPPRPKRALLFHPST